MVTTLLHIFALTTQAGPINFNAAIADGAEAVIVGVTAGAAVRASAAVSKVTGGGLGKFYGSAQGFFSGRRGRAAKTNVSKMATGDRFKGNNPLARSFNDLTQNAGLGVEGRFGIGRRGRAMRDIRTRAAATAASKAEVLQEGQFDDDGIAALYLSAGQSGRRASRELTRLHQRSGVWDKGWNEQRVARAVSSAEAMGINQSNAIAAGSLGADNKFRSLGFGQDASDAIAQTNAMLAGGQLDDDKNYVGANRQLFDNLEGGVRYHARTHGATHLAWKSMEDSWDKVSMAELNASAPAAKAAFGQMIAAGLRSSKPDAQARAATRALELHTILSHGTDAGSQEEILAFENSIGYNDTERGRPGQTFESFLASRPAGSGISAGGLSGEAIRARARTYDAQSYDQSRYGSTQQN